MSAAADCKVSDVSGLTVGGAGAPPSSPLSPGAIDRCHLYRSKALVKIVAVMPTAMPLQACDMQELCRLRSMFPEFVFPSSRLTERNLRLKRQTARRNRPGIHKIPSIWSIHGEDKPHARCWRFRGSVCPWSSQPGGGDGL